MAGVQIAGHCLETVTRNYRDPEEARTLDPQLRRLLLYPTELPDLMRGKDAAATYFVISLSFWYRAS